MVPWAVFVRCELPESSVLAPLSFSYAHVSARWPTTAYLESVCLSSNKGCSSVDWGWSLGCGGAEAETWLVPTVGGALSRY